MVAPGVQPVRTTASPPLGAPPLPTSARMHFHPLAGRGVAANLAGLLWRAADMRPQFPGVIDRDGVVAFGGLRLRAAAIAHALRERGIVPGDRVGLLLERSADAAAAQFGTWAAGAVGVGINDRLRPRQMEHLLSHSGAKALVTTSDVMARNARPLQTTAEIVDLGTIPRLASAVDMPVPRAATDVAQIIYTSGSTGMPKGVVFTHGTIATAIRIVASYLDLHARDRIASLLGFTTVYGLNQLLCAVHRGATLVIETSPLADGIVRALVEHQVTVAAGVPPLWSQLLAVPGFRRAVPSLRVLQNAGGHLPASVTRQLRAAQPHAQLYLQYGMTETFRTSYLAPGEVDRRPDCMGKPIPATEVLVVRDDLTPCEPDEVGELVHRGPTVAAGYWNDPEGTARVFRPDPQMASPNPVVFSGDLVRRDADGYLYYVSRRDRLIKTLGFRVGPDEISDVLLASGELQECAVTSEPDARRGERIVAFVVLARGGSIERLNRFSRVELPTHMQPARVVVLDAIPRLVSGKYDMHVLRGEPLPA